jgi:hypothetical protein
MGGVGNHSSKVNTKIQSSFKSCRDKNIFLTGDGNHIGHCLQGNSNSFESLDKILKIGTVFAFQKKLMDKVHTKIEFKIFETEMLEACANNNLQWFNEKNISADQKKLICDKQLDQIRTSIRDRFQVMRKHLALSASPLREDSFLNDQSNWYQRKITHGMFSDFSSLKPITSSEDIELKKEFIEEMSSKILSAEIRRKGSVSLTMIGSNIHTINDIIEKGKKTLTSHSAKEILINFLSDKSKSYSFRNISGMKDEIQKNHKLEYFKVMNQMPLMGYIDEVKLTEQNSPTDLQLSQALLKTKNKLTTYLSKLKSNAEKLNNIKWSEYAQFMPDIEQLLDKNPEYCGVAETFLKVKSKEEKVELYEDLAIALTASAPCFFGGPITEVVCIGAGVSIGAKGLIKTVGEENSAEARNLTDFLGEDGYANFQALDQKNREIKLQAFLLPMGAWGKGAAKGKVVAHSLGVYKDAGTFITKAEGMNFANQAMEKLITSKKFDTMTAAERAVEFDKILADKVLPKHLLSFLENKKGGFKLIDTNYDLDSIPNEIIEILTKKLGSKEAAIKFVKDTYHRHVLDHHGSLGNVQNATQQVLLEYSTKAAEAANKCSNAICRAAALKLAERDLQKAFYKVSTDNLGDGQLATYLVKNNAKQMLTDPKFVKFMNRVANMEDFEAFGPGLYKKFADFQTKIKKGIKLNTDELEEFNAMNIAMARQKAINDTLLKYGTDTSIGSERISLLYADRFHTLAPEVQTKLMSEVDELTKKILQDKTIREKMANEYVGKVFELSGSTLNPGLVRQAEVKAQSTYAGLESKAITKASDEIFAFNASKLRSEYQKSNNGKILGAFETFHAPAPILGDHKKILVSISDAGEKRTFVVAFGNGLRKNDDSLKSIAKEIHLVEKRTLEKLMSETSSPEKSALLKKELEGIDAALNNPNIENFGGPASFMRSADDDGNVKDLVFNFNGIRSSEADIMEAVIRGRAAQAEASLQETNKAVRTELFNRK